MILFAINLFVDTFVLSIKRFEEGFKEEIAPKRERPGRAAIIRTSGKPSKPGDLHLMENHYAHLHAQT